MPPVGWAVAWGAPPAGMRSRRGLDHVPDSPRLIIHKLSWFPCQRTAVLAGDEVTGDGADLSALASCCGPLQPAPGVNWPCQSRSSEPRQKTSITPPGAETAHGPSPILPIIVRTPSPARRPFSE